MDITDASYAFVQGCVVGIDCEAGATGQMVCAIVYRVLARAKSKGGGEG